MSHRSAILRHRHQIFAFALFCGSLAGIGAYWMRGELVQQGIFTTEPMHIPCLNAQLAGQIAAELQSLAFRESLCSEDFAPDDLEMHAVADGKWVEAKLTLRCWGRASYSLLKFEREFDASDATARARNDKLLERFDAKMKEVSAKALAP